jgi:hypothetical protein
MYFSVCQIFRETRSHHLKGEVTAISAVLKFTLLGHGTAVSQVYMDQWKQTENSKLR